MVQEALNGIITLMLAKFMLNDVPHALGISGTSEPGWNGLLAYAELKNIPLEAAYLAEHTTLPKQTLDNVKLAFGGYYLIAIGKADDRTVSRVYHLLKTELDSMINEFIQQRDVDNLDIDTLVSILQDEAHTSKESQETLRIMTFALDVRRVWFGKAYPDRQDKVFAIDALFHMMHERGRYIMMFFALNEGPLDYALEAAVKELAK